MSTDPFITAARAEALRWWQTPASSPGNVIEQLGQHMAVWARDHLSEQEPTNAEVEAAAQELARAAALIVAEDPKPWGWWTDHNRARFRHAARCALIRARAARRDSEKQ